MEAVTSGVGSGVAQVSATRTEATRLSDAVARAFEAWIAQSGLAEGDRLPTEKALCERFGVSRAVVREVIARLKADGVVSTRQGAGAFVAALPGHTSFRFDSREADTAQPNAMRELFELRYMIETGAAELAACRRDARDVARLADVLGCMDDALRSGRDGAAEDDAFHVAVAAASRNAQLERFQAYMGRQLSETRVPTWSSEGHATGRAAQAQCEHWRLFEAIRAGDPVAARAAAAAHLISAVRRLGLPPLPWAAAALE